MPCQWNPRRRSPPTSEAPARAGGRVTVGAQGRGLRKRKRGGAGADITSCLHRTGGLPPGGEDRQWRHLPATALADRGAQARPQAAATPHGASRKRRRLQRPAEEPLLSSLLYGLTTALGPNNARCRFFPHTCNFTFRLQFSIYLHALVYQCCMFILRL